MSVYDDLAAQLGATIVDMSKLWNSDGGMVPYVPDGHVWAQLPGQSSPYTALVDLTNLAEQPPYMRALLINRMLNPDSGDYVPTSAEVAKQAALVPATAEPAIGQDDQSGATIVPVPSDPMTTGKPDTTVPADAADTQLVRAGTGSVEASPTQAVGGATATADQWAYAYVQQTGSAPLPAPEDYGFVGDGRFAQVTRDEWLGCLVAAFPQYGATAAPQTMGATTATGGNAAQLFKWGLIIGAGYLVLKALKGGA